MNRTSYITPGRLLFAFVFFAQFFAGLYSLRQLEPPWMFDTLSRITTVWLMWWWLRDDSRRRGITWMLDLGMFLYIAWIFLLPYHLFKTRGPGGFIPILRYILVVLGAYATAVMASALL